MPKLKIDNLEIDVPQGTKIIKAAEQLGIMIPRFCYHEGLGPVGACRMCAVKFVEGPVKGVQMSCMVDAQDGMIVSTTDEEAVDFRAHVIEWLMLNHPHDCPVCDEGGHCLLQDMTVSGGHRIRRYRGKKRTYRDQYLGTLVQHEMNRCIHCYRCWRFYQEFSGYRDFGALRLGSRTYFGRVSDGPLESPFSGNLIDLCPTGVFTDKPARFKGRRWDFERASSLCIHCSLGCHTVASARYREVTRIEARFSETVNGHFICDRGRFGFYYAHHPLRPHQARVGKDVVPLSEAIEITSQRLIRIARNNGTRSLACLGSVRNSTETQAMLAHLYEQEGLHRPAYFIDDECARKVRIALSRLDPRLAVSLRDIERSDCVITVGADPLNEAPMLAMAMRQACRKGAAVIVMDPRPLALPLECVHLPVSPSAIDLCLSVLVKGMVRGSSATALGNDARTFYDAIPGEYPFDSTIGDRISALLPRLQRSRNPVIVCGTCIVNETTPSLAADNALLLHAEKGKAGLFYVLPGSNAFGAALWSSSEGSLIHIIDAIEKGAIKALIVVESDPFGRYPDRQRFEQAISHLELLVLLDYVPSRTAQRADILLPTSTVFETRASYINQEARMHSVAPVYSGGIPVSRLGSGQHPPRVFRNDIPGGEPLAAWQTLGEVARALSPTQGRLQYKDLWSWIAQQHPAFCTCMPSDDRQPDDIRLILGHSNEQGFSPNSVTWKNAFQRHDEGLELLLVDWTFGTEELSQYSTYIQQIEQEPCLYMHHMDAQRLGLGNGRTVVIDLDGGPLELKLCVAENMAPGYMFVPRHRKLEWQKIKGSPVIVPLDMIREV